MGLIDMQTFACGAYGWFQQALIRLCVCAAVALIAVLVPRAQAVRDADCRAVAWHSAFHTPRLFYRHHRGEGGRI